MSLDVRLSLPGSVSKAGSGIYVRESGQTRQITREEWDKRFPGREPVVASASEEVVRDSEVYSDNITHNLNKMATAAGLYEVLWRPEEVGMTKASQLISFLEKGLERLRSNPDEFKKYNPDNGWGTYEGLCTFVDDYLAACKKFPNADVSVSR